MDPEVLKRSQSLNEQLVGLFGFLRILVRLVFCLPSLPGGLWCTIRV